MSEETTETITEEVVPSSASNPDDLIATVDESIPASSEETQKTDEKTEEETKAAETAEAEKKEAEATKQAQEDDARRQIMIGIRRRISLRRACALCARRGRDTHSPSF